MNNSFRNSFVIEMSYFFTEDEIFQQLWAAGANGEGVLIIGNRRSLIGCQCDMAR
jgi:phosphatidylserine/phosphatidylglycerophosphate/cardiolipin synthase-like enzyme